MTMIARSSRIPLLGGGKSGINIFLVLKKRRIRDSVQHVLCQRTGPLHNVRMERLAKLSITLRLKTAR